jgi:putative transposase
MSPGLAYHPPFKGDRMANKEFTEKQIRSILRQVEGGVPVAEICGKLGITEKTFSGWQSKYAGTGDDADLHRLKQLEEENRKLKLLVVELSLDKQMLQDVLKKTLKEVNK